MALIITANTPIEDSRGIAQSSWYITVDTEFWDNERVTRIKIRIFSSKADFDAGKLDTQLPDIIPELYDFRDDITAGQYSNVDHAQIQGLLAGFIQDGSNAPGWNSVTDLQGIIWPGLKGLDPLNTVIVELR